MTGSIPNALIIGAGKAGSTSLYRYLDAHPRIAGSKVKEIMYFSSKFDEGVDWYRSHFPAQDGVDIYFEATPQYSFRDEFPKVAERVSAYNPDMALLYIVREPLSRIVSHFNHWCRVFPDKYSDIEQSLSSPAHRKYFIDRTRYYYQLEAYLAHFPEKQVKVVFLEDFKTDFSAALNAVYRFLGVEECADQVENKVFNRRKVGADTQLYRIEDISQERRREITRTLSDDVQKLFAHCGKPADFWGNAYT